MKRDAAPLYIVRPMRMGYKRVMYAHLKRMHCLVDM